MKKKKLSLASQLILRLPVLEYKHFGRWLTKKRLHLIRLLPDREFIIEKVFKNCVVMTLLLKTQAKFLKSITCILESPLISNWTIFKHKLNSSNDLNTLTILLFKMLVQDSILKGKDCNNFWSPIYKVLSEKLQLPIKTSCPDLLEPCSRSLSQKLVEKSPCLTRISTSLANRNLQTTSYQLSTASFAEEWAKDLKKNKPTFKTFIVKVKLNSEQRNQFILHENVFRYVHNKTLERIKKGWSEHNFQDLRNLLVTNHTKMYSNTYKYHTMEMNRLKTLRNGIIINEDDTDEEKIRKEVVKKSLKELIDEDDRLLREALKNVPERKNPYVLEWEAEFHKDTRANAVKKVCNSYTTAIANLKNGTIRSFVIHYMKKNQKRKSFALSSKQLKLVEGNVHIPCFGTDPLLKVNKRTRKKLAHIEIDTNHTCDFVRHKNEYFIHIPIQLNVNVNVNVNEKQKFTNPRYCGVDPGIVKFGTTFGNNSCVEYIHNRELLRRYNEKIRRLKTRRIKREWFSIRRKRKGTRKKQINKVEKKKSDYTDNLHWTFVNDILRNNDVVFFGDIKSHDIVKRSKNKSLNVEFNDLKFYILKQRLIYKSRLIGKKVILVNEAYTSQGCAECGTLQNIVSKRVYSCKNCNIVSDRDVNSAKNILMKGILTMGTMGDKEKK